VSNRKKKSLPENDLVMAIRNKEKAGAEALYDMYSSSLYGIIFRVVQHEEMAEDLLQDTFLRIWNSFESYDSSKGRLFTWMVNIARNIAIDKTRSKDFRNSAKTEDIENNALTLNKQSDNSLNPEAIGLRELVAKLKPEQKMILDMVYFRGFTHAEVSEELDIPLGTVKTRLRNAIISLRKVFN